MKFIIDESANGKTVLTYLKSIVKISSGTKSHLKTLPDGICVNGSRVTVRYVLNAGDVLSINSDDTNNESDGIVPVNLPIEIVYEDDNILLLNKGAGLAKRDEVILTAQSEAHALASERRRDNGRRFAFAERLIGGYGANQSPGKSCRRLRRCDGLLDKVLEFVSGNGRGKRLLLPRSQRVRCFHS